jgi:hypothetical protein
MTKTIPDSSDRAQRREDAGKKRQATRIANAVLARARQEQTKGFALQAFVRFGFPLVRTEVSTWEAEDHVFKYRLVADPQYGLPFGDDFLTLFWLTSAFTILGCPEDGIVRFRSPRDVLLPFDPGTGELDSKWRRQLRGSFERLHGVTCFVTKKSLPGHLASRRFGLLDACNLWFKDPQRSPQNQHTLEQLALFPNWIRLSPELCQMAADHMRVPLDFESLSVLRRKPLAAKLYAWEAWRASWPDVRSRGIVRVPVFGPLGLAQQLGISLDQGVREVRRALREAQATIRERAWPECPSGLDPGDGDTFLVKSGRAILTARVNLPGVQRDRDGRAAVEAAQAAQKGEANRLVLVRKPGEDDAVESDSFWG